MIKKPYIGVTDFTSKSEVDTITSLLPDNFSHRLHVGAMISYKTLNKIPTQTGWENIWLDEVGLKSLFVPHEKVFNVIHYADYDPLKPTIAKDLLSSIDMCGPGLDGIQLDMIWPRHSLLKAIKESYPNLSIILQVSSAAINDLPPDISLKQMLQHYKNKNHTDYILLDYGMGKGTVFEPSKALSLIELALTVFEEDSIAVAGGLGPNTYNNLKEILKKYPGLGCDAQGKLRPSGSAIDPLDFDLVASYVKGVVSLLPRSITGPQIKL